MHILLFSIEVSNHLMSSLLNNRFAKLKPKNTFALEETQIKDHKLKRNDYIVENIISLHGHHTEKLYLKKNFLGKGGFANCYITQQMGSEKELATKIISKSNLNSNKSKMRLMNEIKIHKTFRHENIVEFVHYFQDRQNVYIMLELCENQSLNQVIRERGSFSTPEIQSFLYGICNGVKYLHDNKYIHRDLKLGNIFLNDKFQIKIGDFGLTSQLEFLKENKRTVCGTPNYIAPQVLEGTGYYFEVDIWAIGIILYTLYYGCPPFQSDLTHEIYTKIRNCSYNFPKNVQVPPEAIYLIQSILVSDPTKRPSINQILSSPFLKLGKCLYLELPNCCSFRSPSRKQLSQMPSITFFQSCKNIIETQQLKEKDSHEKSTKDGTLLKSRMQFQEKPLSLLNNIEVPSFNMKVEPVINEQVLNNGEPNVFIKEFQMVGNDTYYFCTNLMMIGIYEKNKEIYFRELKDFKNQSNKIWNVKLCHSFFSQKTLVPFFQCPYKTVLSIKAKQFLSAHTKSQTYKHQFENKIKRLDAHHIRSGSNPVFHRPVPELQNKKNERQNEGAQINRDIFLSKIGVHKEMIMLRLSNKNIQVVFDDLYDGFVFENKSEKIFYFPKLHFSQDEQKQNRFIELKLEIIHEILTKNPKIKSDCQEKIPNILVSVPIASNTLEKENLEERPHILKLTRKNKGSKNNVRISAIKLNYMVRLIEQLRSKKKKHVKNRHSQ